LIEQRIEFELCMVMMMMRRSRERGRRRIMRRSEGEGG
jgi:hypothetical protein